jgi:hypothetical protein
MTMDKEAAEAAFREYRAAFMAERNRIDGELMRGYKALREGKQLIRLSESITAGGVDAEGKPRLAIARADEQAATFERTRDGSVRFSNQNGSRARDRSFSLPAGTLPPVEFGAEFTSGWGLQALVPIVPPRFRPPRSGALTGYHVLWEAIWKRAPRAPRDPALLKHLGGDLWAVLAVWDLTDLERAVLEMRAS